MLNWWIVLLAGTTYFWLIIRYKIGLSRVFRATEDFSIPESGKQASIVVAVRNEEDTVKDFLDHILQSENINFIKEIILVNDHSQDATPDILKHYETNHTKVILLNQPHDASGKKQALLRGIKAAASDIILTTDADCQVGDAWVKAHLSGFRNNRVLLQAGLVTMGGDTFYDKIQEIEFSSLMASAAGAAGVKKPVLVNAANLSFRKETYLSAHHQLTFNHPSGDDMFLLQSVKKQNPDRFQFITVKGSAVKTAPKKSLKAFLHQRLRWAAKSHLYTDKDIIVSGAVVLSINILLLAYLFLAILNVTGWTYYLVLFILKTLADITLLNRYFRHVPPSGKGLFYILPLQIMYPFYAAGIGLFSQFVKIRWKDRTYYARNPSRS